jgi:oxygen-independent coproporphyrinogen-3 oxidase
VRELNTRDVRVYIQRLLSGGSPTFQSEQLQPRERAVETMVVQLRRASGIDRGEFLTQTAFNLDDLVGPKIEALAAEGILRDEGAGVSLTRRGKCLADAVVQALMAAAQ